MVYLFLLKINLTVFPYGSRQANKESICSSSVTAVRHLIILSDQSGFWRKCLSDTCALFGGSVEVTVGPKYSCAGFYYIKTNNGFMDIGFVFAKFCSNVLMLSLSP